MTEINETDVDTVVTDDETSGEDTSDQKDQEASESSKESDEDASTTKDEDNTEEADDEEPPTRKPRTNADWVALRRQRKLEKQADKSSDRGEADDEDEIEDEDISPEDAKVIDRVVQKRLEPILAEKEQESLKSEINTFIDANPDFKPFASKALKWAVHPSWKNVPTEQLMYAVAGKQLLTIGAKRREIADKKISQTKVGGNSSQSTSSKSVWDMSDEEFEQEVNRVKTGT